MKNILGANWLPKIVGFLGGIALALVDAWDRGTMVFSVKGIATIVVSTAIGLVVKAYNTTGIGAKATNDPTKDATKIADVNP